MELTELIKSFVQLGKLLDNLSDKEKYKLYIKASAENGWITAESLKTGIKGLQNYLDDDKLNKWAADYDIPVRKPKSIGIVMAGNIPFVGFHDLLCVLISGHNAVIKPSSKDRVNLEFIIEKLIEVNNEFEPMISIVEKLTSIDAVIATGSDNSSRYFKYYFSKYPHIIRKNRTSIGILNGSESPEDLQLLSDDIFQYFGLGCRNVSKIFVPDNLDIESIFDSFPKYESLTDNHKYANNYLYQKSIALTNKEQHYDPGYVVVKEKEELSSPIGVLFYEKYKDTQDLKFKLSNITSKIQCIVSHNKWFNNSIPMGTSQSPELWDYADHIDTLNFLVGNV